MNKLKNVFQRSSQKIKTTEDRRPQQFVKRHSAAMVTPLTIPTVNNNTMSVQPPPAINLSDLSEMEKPAYQTWWKDLDPFDLQKINNQTILKFLNGCSLEDSKLEQILALFETAGDGLNKLQFFAMLRLIAHAQNGRKISRALVYLGAPIPHFHTNAIDALIKSDIPQRRLSPSSSTNKEMDKKENKELEEQTLEMIPNNNNNNSTNRKSWWGNEKQQQIENRRSYMGPFTAHTLIPNSPFHQQENNNNNNNAMMDYFYPLSPTAAITSPITTFNTFSPPNNTSWPHPEQQQHTTNTNNNTPNNNLIISTSNMMMRPILTSSVTTTATINPVTPNIIQLEEKYTHSRSRSAGTASDFIQAFNNPYQSTTTVEEAVLQSSRSSLSLHELNTGQSLLLTQKFVYQSPSVRNQELLLSSSNPFNITPTTTVDINTAEETICSPFDDNNNSDDDDDNNNNDIIEAIIQQQQEEDSPNHVNFKPNTHCIPPPPVPNQSTKPAFPKYTRTNTFLIKRSQSTTADRTHNNISRKHQRHKSTSATNKIFY